MKLLRNILGVVIWACVGLYFSLIVLLHIPSFQSLTGEWIAAALAKRLGANVTVGRVDLGFLNRLIVDDVLIYDQSQKEMLCAKRLSVKIDLPALTQGRIVVSSAQMFGARLHLYKANATARPNYQFALDSLASKDTTSKSTLDLRINSFIVRHSSVTYDRYDIAPTNGRFNAAHINVSDISGNIQLKALRKDSINLNVRRLSFSEGSGAKVERLSLKAEGGLSGLRLHDFVLKMPNSTVAIPEVNSTYSMKDGSPDMASLRYNGEIGTSTIALTDLGCILPAMRNFTVPLTLSANFDGDGEELRIKRLKISAEDNSIAMNAGGWIKWQKNASPLWHVDMRNLWLADDAITMLYSCFAGKDKETPPFLTRIGEVKLTGVAASSPEAYANASFTVSSGIGDANIDITLLRNGLFTSELSTDGLALNVLTDDEKLGSIAMMANVNGRYVDKQSPSLTLKGSVSHFDYGGYRYNDIALNGTYADKVVSGTVTINDPNANLTVGGDVRKNGKGTSLNLSANINKLVPAALNMTRKWGDASFAANVVANVSGSNIANVRGDVEISNFSMASSNGDYGIDKLICKSGDTDGKRYITMNSDFGHAEIVGRFDPSTMLASLTNYISSKLPTMPWLHPSTVRTHNDYLVSATIYDTEWAEKLLNVPLHINQTASLNGKIEDSEKKVYLNCVIPSFSYDGHPYKDASVALTSPSSGNLHCDARIAKLLDNGDCLNLSLKGNAMDNKLSTSFNWSNTKGKKIAGQFNADAQVFANLGKKAAHIDILPSHVDIDGTIWDVSPSSIVYSDRKVVVDNFSINHGSQHILIDGTASQSRADSLTVDLKEVDVSYVLNLVNFHTVEFGGLASGNASLKAPFGDLSAEARLSVGRFTFENGRLGTLEASVKWNKGEKQIDIDGVAIDGPGQRLYINGYVSPSRSHIDLGMRAENTRLEFMRSFTSSFSNDIDGTARGEIRLAGPMSNLNLTGQLVVNGSATIDPLGCKYTMTYDTVLFVPDDIQLHNAIIHDKDGNVGFLTGGIHHKHLTNMTYDLDVVARNLLVYDFKDFGDDTFYGTVYGTGNVGIHGRNGELTMDIDLTPEKNTTFVYDVANPDDISSQEFIHWNDATPTPAALRGAATAETKKRTAERMPGTDTYLNFNLDVTPDATMKLLMDSHTNDYITLNGHGSIRATYYNKGSFNMFGTYTVDRGTYGITIQDIIKKNFTFNEGGTVVFGGNPFDAALNLQAVYTVNGVSLSDLNIGNSFSSNTIRVNCLMNIGGQPRQPVVDFDIDMPTVSTDEKQMVRSVLNSEDEMNQQVLYLLGIGRFYPQGNNNATTQDGKQKNQTSLAMQSLLSGTLSSQINSLLGTVINSNNWNFGANISTGDEGWNNAEYEGLLSGRLLNNRLLINGQFGYRDNTNTATTNFIGDFDIRYLLSPNGNLALKVYNQTNDRYFTKSSLNTQGIGLILKKDFSNLGDLFGRKKKKAR